MSLPNSEDSRHAERARRTYELLREVRSDDFLRQCDQHHFTRLLAGRHDEGRLLQRRRHLIAHSIAQSESGVDVDQRWPARSLGKALGHPDHRCLLANEHISTYRMSARPRRPFSKIFRQTGRGIPVKLYATENTILLLPF